MGRGAPKTASLSLATVAVADRARNHCVLTLHAHCTLITHLERVSTAEALNWTPATPCCGGVAGASTGRVTVAATLSLSTLACPAGCRWRRWHSIAEAAGRTVGAALGRAVTACLQPLSAGLRLSCGTQAFRRA